MLVDHRDLRRFVAALLEAAGVFTERARETANHLVLANLKGHDSHGIGMIPHYLYAIREGHMKPNAECKVFRDQGVALGLDAQYALGQVAGRVAMDMALERVEHQGIAVVAVRNAYHLGRIGSYAEQCAQQQRISIHFVNVAGRAPVVAPWGAREARFMTNPFCCAIPRRNAEPFVLDMATSMIAMGKVRVAHARGEPLEDAALMDADGVPSKDPGLIFGEGGGALSPFGRHKGSGLGLVCELLGGAFAGEYTIQPGNPRADQIHNNMLSILFDKNLFGGEAKFVEEIEAMISYVGSAAPGKGFDRVRTAGEPELECMSHRMSEGVPVEDNTWDQLVHAGKGLGIAFESNSR